MDKKGNKRMKHPLKCYVDDFKENKDNIRSKLFAILTLILGFIGGSAIESNIRVENGVVEIDTRVSIQLAEDQVPAVLETLEGKVEEVFLPTVEEIDGNRLLDDATLDFGQGEYHDISSPEAYKNAVLGKCIDLDGKYGSQCVDGFADFNFQYTGRWLSTCGTGAARGLWDCAEYNAGDDYILITNPKELQSGDWIVFDSGQYGHVGMALGGYNEGYVALLGENQGGEPCPGGGSAFNIINMSLRTFKGAFRPKIYVKPAPEPEPIPVSGCSWWHVEWGDTMSKIMLECEHTIVYGEPMNDYAKTWYSTVIKPGQSVYDGWNSSTGVGLYADDDIEHRTK